MACWNDGDTDRSFFASGRTVRSREACTRIAPFSSSAIASVTAGAINSSFSSSKRNSGVNPFGAISRLRVAPFSVL
ncbi:MAG TPA: hypothetical protein VGK04_03240 [Thermoanaerobaculia bacterium]